MKYTDEEIINKFSNVNFDKTGYKKQAVFNKITSKQAGRSVNMRKRYQLLIAVSAVVLIAAPTAIMYSRGKYSAIKYPNETQAEQTNRPKQIELPAEIASAEKQGAAAETENQQDNIKFRNPLSSSAVKDESPAEQNTTEAASAVPFEEPALDPSLFRDPLSVNTARKSLSANTRTVGTATLAADNMAPAKVFRSAPRIAAAAVKAEGFIIERGIAQEAAFVKSSQEYTENGFKKAAAEPLSTFSADVDTASYDILRGQIVNGVPVYADGVRTEALINNFKYNYEAPKDGEPLAIHLEYSDSPWNKNNKLAKIAVKAKEIDKSALPQSNFVFLVDVSGSMSGSNRLPLVKTSLKMLLNQLSEKDIVSIVTYASGVDVKLDGVSVKNKSEIIKAIDSLYASGSTYGEEGLKKAYEVAKKNFIRKGNNRIIIASDGDFNAGESSRKGIEKQVSDAKESGVFISALGFGMGNYRDDLMETIADKGNGNYAYINDMKSATKALVREFGGTMFTVAKDVKFQVEFNPANVEEYRLIGYEKRALNNADFNDDTKDAGEVGVGHVVTVLYEIRPKGSKEASSVDELKYSQTKYSSTDELLTVKVRYKDPDGDTSKLISKSLEVKAYKPFEQASEDFRFASAAAAFGQFVKGSEFKGDISAEEIANIASAAKGADDSGDRAEFVQLIRTYAATPEPSKNDTIRRAPRNIIF